MLHIDGPRFVPVDSNDVKMVRTMLARSSTISAVIDCIRINLLFNKLRIYPLAENEKVDENWTPPEHYESPPDMRAKEQYFGKFAENAMMSRFIYGFSYFAIAEVDVDLNTPNPEDSVVDQDRDAAPKRGRPSNRDKNKVLVPFVPSDSAIAMRMRLDTYATPEVFFHNEMGPGFRENDVPKKIRALRTADVDMPDEHGRLRSPLASLIRDFTNHVQSELYSIKASYANSSPVAVVRHVPPKNDKTDRIDGAAISGEQTFLYLTPKDAENESTQSKVDAARKAIQDPGRRMTQYDYWNNPLSQIMDPIELKHPIESGLCLLPDGVEMDSQPLLAQAPQNLDRLMHQLVLNTCARFHVPPSFIFYGSGRTTTIASETEKLSMVNTIKRNKEQLEDLMERIYEIIYGERCKMVLKVCPMQTPELFEACFRMGLLSRDDLATLMSESMNVPLRAQPEKQIPVVMAGTKGAQYVIENAGENPTPTGFVQEVKRAKQEKEEKKSEE